MKVAKQAIEYYSIVTGEDYSEFFKNLDSSLAKENPTGNEWLIKSLAQAIIKSGITIDELRANKDTIRSAVDSDNRKSEGEFYTPEIWCKEGRNYFDKHIPDWHDYYIWDCACYSADTEIYTQRGWVRYQNLSNYDYVLSLNPRTLKTEWTTFYKRYERDMDGLMISFIGYSDYSQAVDLLVTEDHKMFGKFKGDSSPIMLSARELLKALKNGKEFYVYNSGSQKPINQFQLDCIDILLHHKDSVISDDTNTLSLEQIEYQTSYIDFRSNNTRLANALENILIDCNYQVKRRGNVIKAEYNSYTAVVGSQEYYKGLVWDITLDKNHVFLVRRNNIPTFCGNCGSGNLMRSANHPPEKLFLSSLQEEDIQLVKDAYPEGVTVFQYDFLDKVDYDLVNKEFFDSLPEKLQYVIKNDLPLIIYSNPPYIQASAKSTAVGRHLCNIGLGRSATDLYYQFLWKFARLVDLFNLSNTYISHFGPATLFTGTSCTPIREYLEHCFSFVDGMVFPASVFSDTSETITWGIANSLWKSRGGYREIEGIQTYLDNKIQEGDTILNKGKILCTPVTRLIRPTLVDWVKPKDVISYISMPQMTSQVNFKSTSDTEVTSSDRIAINALGTMMVGNTMARAGKNAALLSTPTTMVFVNVTPENVLRCAVSFAFRRTYISDWAHAKLELTAPIEGELLTKWQYNALALMICEWKTMTSSIRNVNWKGDTINIYNKFFILSKEEVRAVCTDEVILNDLEKSPNTNEFILKLVEEAKPYWCEEAKELYSATKEYILKSYSDRKLHNYSFYTNSWDACATQLKYMYDNDDFDNLFKDKINSLKEYLSKDIDKLGFFGEE